MNSKYLTKSTFVFNWSLFKILQLEYHNPNSTTSYIVNRELRKCTQNLDITEVNVCKAMELEYLSSKTIPSSDFANLCNLQRK